MMILLNWLFVMVMFLGGVWVFCSSRKHLLAVLLSLEFIVLSLFLGLILYLNKFSYEMFFSMVFLTFSVCEGALGLSILVSMIRTHGNDFFQSFSILQC
uniref:NADH-ubiquinone oxidoreductase chain 4L n=1 Tax=Troglophilus neglectus TaxID=552514 RepID=B6DEE8_TRONE|nr:NADH dehydrogenase subunit 4L [Troglophilus neglectus]ACG59344.1 NADH dehydrogenase subunit 4L [Troglophilus neglectus]